MDISSSGVTQSIAVLDSQRPRTLDLARQRARGDGRREGSDEAVISANGQLLQKLGEAVGASPDVRAKKVAELRSAIQQGRYQLSYEEIAKAILASRAK